MNNIFIQLGEIGIIPVITIDEATQAIPLGKALLDGGLPCAEITFRTAAAAEAIQRMSSVYPQMLVGAGTVLTIEQAKQAKAAGACFVATPGFDMAVVDYCQENEFPITPGVMTPTDINQALTKGLKLLKFFPAEAAGGIKTLKAISAPYVGVKFIPTGGIHINNFADYLGLPMVYACGGSWIAKTELISSGQFETISQLAREAVSLVASVRNSGGGQ
jgi:2-dehydro-3-deoxyphosphogluconate aldolase/(4S)-4-hydroxy-2-oxoglutarate aldolase